MISKNLVVNTNGGIHVGVAVSIKAILKDYEDRVFIKHKSDVVNCKNVLKVVAMNIMQGENITLMVDGLNEEEVIKKLEHIIEHRI